MCLCLKGFDFFPLGRILNCWEISSTGHCWRALLKSFSNSFLKENDVLTIFKFSQKTLEPPCEPRGEAYSGPRKEIQEHPPRVPINQPGPLRLPIPAPSLSQVLATLQELLSPPPHPTYLPLPCLCCSSLIFYLRVLQWVIQEWKSLLTKEKGFPFFLALKLYPL